MSKYCQTHQEGSRDSKTLFLKVKSKVQLKIQNFCKNLKLKLTKNMRKVQNNNKLINKGRMKLIKILKIEKRNLLIAYKIQDKL